MKDLPVFTTQNGVASLTLREIPYQQTAYIKLQATRQPKELLEECVGFCRAVGAEKIYASGHEILENYPFHTAIVQMQCLKESVADTDAALWPLQTGKSWPVRVAGILFTGTVSFLGSAFRAEMSFVL